jgi:aarF domain-containing kinase
MTPAPSSADLPRLLKGGSLVFQHFQRLARQEPTFQWVPVLEKAVLSLYRQANTAPYSSKERQSSAEPPAPVEVDAPIIAREDRKYARTTEAAVPATQVSRVFGFGMLGVRLALGTAISGSAKSGQNAELLAVTLCRMRGAALKLGQMLSIQDDNILSTELTSALEKVREGADRMPMQQLHRVMEEDLGMNWKTEKFEDFDEMPIAAASLGQVHYGRIKDRKSGLMKNVAVKVQYPGVATSIDSDVANLMRVVKVTNFVPKGLYIERAMDVARQELILECDYEHEAAAQGKYRVLLEQDHRLFSSENSTDVRFSVPPLYPDFCSKRILTSEYVTGVPLDQVARMDQETRDAVGVAMLQLTLTELFEWNYMQTDPNWSNFLYDAESRTCHLIDFGATRSFPKAFVDQYLRMVLGAANSDESMFLDASVQAGFLSGKESDEMIAAHVAAGMVVGEPFRAQLGGGPFHFGGTEKLTARVTGELPTIGRDRLQPPPTETYSLHRKLSGAFLAAIKLRSRIPSRDILLAIVDQYQFSDPTVTT